MEPLHQVMRRQIATDAIANGFDAAQAALAWDACVKCVASMPQLAPQPGETREQKKQRRAELRKQRTELREAATSALGATLLTLLLNWALGRLVNWIVDRVLGQAEVATYGDWAVTFPEQRIDTFAAIPVAVPVISWQCRAVWAIYDIAVRLVLR